MESVFITMAIIGLVEVVKAANGHDWATVEIIVFAVLIGAAAGQWNVDGLTIVSGIEAGLAAAGTYAGLKLVGNGS